LTRKKIAEQFNVKKKMAAELKLVKLCSGCSLKEDLQYRLIPLLTPVIFRETVGTGTGTFNAKTYPFPLQIGITLENDDERYL